MTRSSVVASLLGALLLSAPSMAFAQKAVSTGEVVSDTFTITAIDQTSRVVTLENKDGLATDILCGPDVQRFNELKVGDKVTFRYYESVVHAIAAPGASRPPTDSSAVTGTTGQRPGGTIARQLTTTVTINAIDPDVPSVTVTTARGPRMSFKVADKKNLEGYKVGDRVDITYTQALAISVESPK